LNSGRASILITTPGNQVVKEVPVDSLGPQQVAVVIPDLAAAGNFIIRNQSENGPSELTVHSVQVFRPSPDASSR
jgi:hypothetical protein